jgi:flagellar hook-associated protein 2
MVTSIQLGNIFSQNGRTVVSGSNSGFDIEALVNSLADIKRLPAVQLESRLEQNSAQRTAFNELSTVLRSYEDTSNLLRNPPGIGNDSENIFEYRNATVTSNSGVAGSTYLSVTAAPGATVSDYDITVDSVASFNIKTTETFALADLNTDAVGAGLPFNAGTLTLGPNDVDITIGADDTLQEIITKANAVEDLSGVRVSALQISDGNYRLQFKTLETGTDQNYELIGSHQQVGNEIVIEAEDFTQNISRSGDSFTSGAGAGASGFFFSAQPSDGDTYTANIETTAPELTYDVTFDAPGRYYIYGRARGGSANDSFHVGLNGVAPASGQGITGFNNTNFSYSGTSQVIGGPGYIDVAAAGKQTVSIYAREDDTGIDQLVLSSDPAYVPAGLEASTLNTRNADIFNIGLALEEDATDAQLTIDGTQITRQTNSVSDLIEDVTFNLNQVTPPGTEVNVDIEPDTELTRDAILNFVDSYNALRVFYARQSEVNDDGSFSETAVLGQNATVRSTMNTVLNELNSVVQGLSSSPNSLADLGITLQDFEGDAETPATRNILVVDTDTLDNALSADFDAVRSVFEFDFTSDNSDVAVFSRTNALNVNDFTLNLDVTNNVFEATSGGVTVALESEAIGSGGFILRGAAGTDYEGLELIYGSNLDSTATISLTQGIADRIYNIVEAALDEDEGIITSELEGLARSDERLEEDIARIDESIERYRDQQLRRFAALEEAISIANSLLQSLDANANAASA